MICFSHAQHFVDPGTDGSIQGNEMKSTLGDLVCCRSEKSFVADAMHFDLQEKYPLPPIEKFSPDESESVKPRDDGIVNAFGEDLIPAQFIDDVSSSSDYWNQCYNQWDA